MQFDFTDSILHEDLVSGINFKQETEKKIKKAFDKPVIIYGAGKIGNLILHIFHEYDIPVLAVCDNYKKGSIMQSGEKITTFYDVYNKFEDYNIFIASLDFYYEIESDILKYVTPNKIIKFPNVRYMPNTRKFINCNPSCKEYREFIINQKEHIDYVASLMSDVKSKKVLSSIIRSKMTDNLEYISNVSEKNHYFPTDIIKFTTKEVFVDGGAFTGDTLMEFIKRSGNFFYKAYCFEPGIRPAIEFRSNFKDLITSGKVNLIQKGLWDKTETLSFTDCNNATSKISKGDGNNTIQATSIDEAIPKTEKVTFIKMDIEGSELKALHGAEQTIRRNKPKIAVCIYHKPEDMFEIPEYIASLNLGYKFYIRHHGTDPISRFYETVLYVI